MTTVTSARDLRWPDLVWSHFSRPRFGQFDERVAAAAAAGFAGIGLYAPEYERLRHEEGRTAKDIARQLDDHGLALADIETVQGWASSGAAAAECAHREALAYEMADELGCRYLQAIGPYEGSVEDAAEGFGRLCDRAAEHGLLVGIEWLPYTNIATAADARAIVEAAGRANGGYCADIWHHRRGSDDDAQVRALAGDRVFAVQMNDGPRRPQLDDYKPDCMAHRLPPGAGELDCVGFVRLLAEIGVRSPISLEICSTELWAAPAEEAARRAADGMRAVLAEAGV
ncbi:MAG: sugar phosphate isomerase/epimerase family protein [Ilumatobacteraceae bacterium]